MLAALTGLFLAASLITETVIRSQVSLGRGLAVAGLAFLVAAILAPYRPRPPEVHVSERRKQHPAVPHPVRLRLQAEAIRYEKGLGGKVAAGNDWMATHLAVVFGVSWTIWVFFVWPLLAQFFSPLVQAKTSYYAQSWIQLFALPLMVYVGNKLQRSSDAQSEVMHQALTHIAMVSDQNKQLIEQNTELTTQVHALVTAQADSTVAADAKAARSAAESAFVATRALAAVATAGPGTAELAAAVAENTEAVRQVRQAVTAAPEAPEAPEAPRAPARKTDTQTAELKGGG